MEISNVTVFCKLLTCPSADKLVNFNEGSLDSDGAASIEEHLEICDFCCAELRLLENYLPLAETCECTVELPMHLRLLAESILYGKAQFESLTVETSLEKESVSLTDA